MDWITVQNSVTLGLPEVLLILGAALGLLLVMALGWGAGVSRLEGEPEVKELRCGVLDDDPERLLRARLALGQKRYSFRQIDQLVNGLQARAQGW